MNFYFNGKMETSPQRQLEYLNSHKTYNDRHGCVYANSIKIYDLGLDLKQEEIAYSIIADEQSIDEFWNSSDVRALIDSSHIYSAGRMGGWLVLDPDIVDPYPFEGKDVSYHNFVLDELESSYEPIHEHSTEETEYKPEDITEASNYIKDEIGDAYDTLVDFDKKCDQLRDMFIAYIDNFKSLEEVNND